MGWLLYSYAFLLESDIRRGALLKAFTDSEDYCSGDELVDYISNILVQDFPNAHWLNQLQLETVEFGEKTFPFKSRFADSKLYSKLTNKCISQIKKEIDYVLNQASSVSKNDAQANLQMAELVEAKSKKLLKELRQVFGKGDNVYVEYADNVANQILDNCIDYYTHDADNPKRARNVIKYTRYAYRTAESKTTKERAKKNLDILNETLENLIPESIEEEFNAIDELVLSYHANTKINDYSEKLISIVEKVYSIVLSIKKKIGRDNNHYIYVTSNFVQFVLQEVKNAINNCFQQTSSYGRDKYISTLHWGRQIMDLLAKFDLDDNCQLEYDKLFIKIIDGLAAVKHNNSTLVNNSSNSTTSSDSQSNNVNSYLSVSKESGNSGFGSKGTTYKASEPPKTSAQEEEQDYTDVSEAQRRLWMIINRIRVFFNDYLWWSIGVVVAILLIAFLGIAKGYEGLHAAFIFIGTGIAVIAFFKMIRATKTDDGCAHVFLIAVLGIGSFILSAIFKSCHKMHIEEQKELLAFDELMKSPSRYECEDFISQYPKSERIEEVMAICYRLANQEGLLGLTTFYNKHVGTAWGEKANQRRKEICDSLYNVALTEGTINSWLNYQQAVPTDFVADSQEKIDSLERIRWKTDETAWRAAQEYNTITAYQKYLDLYPRGKHKRDADKKIIDAQVDDIMAGEHGNLAGMDRVSYGTGITSTVSVKNSTLYTLTLLYSGPDSKRLVLSPNQTSTITLKNGTYRVAASVTDNSVSNYAGSETLQGGGYSVEYYISTTSIPRFR